MRRLRIVVLLVGTFVAIGAALVAAAAAAPQTRAGYVLIRHPGNPVEAVDRQFIEDAFLKRKTTWPTGVAIRPVDLAPSSPLRRQFSDEVLRRPVDAVRSYWQQRLFAGRDLPPPEVAGDDEVVRFVLREKGAIGYVSGSAALQGTRPLNVK